jgi:hypothetical protein
VLNLCPRRLLIIVVPLGHGEPVIHQPVHCRRRKATYAATVALTAAAAVAAADAGMAAVAGMAASGAADEQAGIAVLYPEASVADP